MSLFGNSKSGPVVGIDIGTNLIKVVEAKPGKDGAHITAIGIGPTPPGAIDNEIIIDPHALGQSIKHLLAESGIKTKRCVSSVAGQSSVVVRIIEVPRMSRAELAETMKWEVERHVPFAAEEVAMDYEPIERPGDDPDAQNMEVLLAVAQQEVINSHIEALVAAGLQPSAIDVESLAASRAIIDASHEGLKDLVVATINVGAMNTELGVYNKGILAFPRTLPLAGNSITKAISEHLQLSEEEAERVKRDRGVVLMDRAATIMHTSGDDLLGGMGQGGQDAAPDADQQPQDFDLAFIPGLAVDPMTPPSAPVGSTSTPATPDFDIDIGGAQAPKPLLDFDMGMDDEQPVTPVRPALDLSGEDLDFNFPGLNLSKPTDAPVPAPEPDFGLTAQTPAAETPDTTSVMPSLDLISAPFGSEQNAEFTEEQVFDAMAPALADLVMEIRRSLDYYTGRYGVQPEKLVLCGGTAKLRHLDKLIEMEIGIPVILANPLQNVTIFSRTLSDDYLEEVASVLPVSVGLAIRDMIGE